MLFRSPGEGKFRVHLVDGPMDFSRSEEAMTHLEGILRRDAIAAADAAGAQDVHVSVNRDVRTAGVEARDVFVEAQVIVEATGRPRVAHG